MEQPAMRNALPRDNTHPLRDEQVALRARRLLDDRNLFDAEEVELMIRVAREDRALHEHAYGRKDAQGRESRLALWNHPGDDLFGMVSLAANRRCHGASPRRRGLSLPLEADAQGAFRGRGLGVAPGLRLLVPERLPVSLHGQLPHRFGCGEPGKRLPPGAQGIAPHRPGGTWPLRRANGADPERVEAARQRLEHVYCEAAPGSGLFFHGNLLHASDANTSPNPRWSLICCYNAAPQRSLQGVAPPAYTPLKKVPDAAVKEVVATMSSREKSFLDPATDKS